MRRSSMLHKSALSLFGASGIVLAAASLAFACSGAPSVTFRGGQAAASSSAGPAGSRVALEGKEWAAGPVEIRWNSAVGDMLAQPSGPSFSVDVTIPQAQPGVYTIYLVQLDTVARASFEVTPSASNAGGGGSPETTRTGQSSASTSGDDAHQSTTTPAGSAVPSQGGVQSFATPTGSEDTTSGATPQPASSGPTSTGAASSTARAQSPAAAPVGGSATVGNQAVFGGSLATAAPAAPADDQATTPAPSTVSGDLYSGFNASGDASLLPSVADSARTSSSPAGQAAVGMALFGASLVALFGGFAVAEVRRRKVLSQPS